jgi:outer membrane lipoprotein-sorting protein
VNRLLRALVVLPALALVACGGGGGTNGIEKLSGDKALAKVKADVAGVQSVHAHGTVSQAGKQLQLDVHVAQSKGVGTLGIGDSHIDMRLVDGTAYVRGDTAAYTAFGATPQEAQLVADKWLKGSSDSGDLSNFSNFLDLKQLFDSLLTPQGTVKTGGTTTVNGQKAFVLIDSSDGGKLYVAETGKALPLRIEKTGTGGGTIDFSDYDADVSVSAPEGAIDLSQLGSSSG